MLLHGRSTTDCLGLNVGRQRGYRFCCATNLISIGSWLILVLRGLIRHRACGTLRRGRMPRAAKQGFCNLLRNLPTAGSRPPDCTTPTPG
eukprot:7868321-Pyramimonas_sp.AAC.1